MKRIFTAGVLLGVALSGRAQTYVDLSASFDADAVLEANGAGMGDALDAEGRRLDATTLPAAYADGSVVATPDGLTTFRFGMLKQPSRDAVAVNGQVVAVANGNYESLDLAMMAAAGAFADPFGAVELRYADGSKEERRLGPVPGWFASPMAFDHTLYRYTDSSQVQTLASFRTDFGAAEAAHLVQEIGNGNSGGTRFVDGNGYVLYRLGELGDLKAATLGVTVGNNFVISIATEYLDPDASRTDGYTVVADSMVIYEGFEHRALGNLKQYDIDLAPFLAAGTGEIYVLLTDATTANGWGPYLQEVRLFTGTPKTFEEVLEPAVDARQATVHAMFRVASDAEKPYLYDNSGSGPSNRGHRFADAGQSITYRFDLADDVTAAQLTVDLANNFVVSLAGPSESVRYFNVAAATPEEQAFLVDDGGSATGADFRFADGGAYMIYRFDLPDDVTAAFAKIHVGNQFVIEAAGETGDFTVERDWVAETGDEVTDNSNLDFYDVDLAPYLANNPSRIVRLRLSDGVPSNGWGPFLKSIAIQSGQDSGEAVFTPVLEAQALFGEDIHTEYNKRYYTVDLASVLQNNARKEFFVRFTDGSASDGWGPGIFWMAVHTGDIAIQTDRLVFDGLKTTLGDPANYGAALLHRRYAVNAGKTLAAIALPAQPASQTNRVYLLAATLNGGATAPTLGVVRTPEGKVRISWPATAAGFKAQTTASLGGNVSWADVQDPPQMVGTELILEVTPTDPARYYRLAK